MTNMLKPIDRKRLIIYIAIAFGISWATALVIYLTGGLQNSPTYTLAGEQISLALILMATIYMFAPAIANFVTRKLTSEGKADLFLQPHFKNKVWPYFLAAWFLPGLLTILGMILFFGLFPQYFDSSFSSLTEMLKEAGETTSLNPWLIILIQTLQTMLISPILNAIPTFGEEFGWRGYLQPKLMPLGGRKALLLTGMIWGVWHWPIILMGHNYGLDYFGAPFLGPLGMVWFTLTISVIFGWLTIKAGSVWPAVIGHGAMNGIASLGILFVKNNPDPLLGPAPVGLIGGLGFTVIAAFILARPEALEPKKT